MESNKNKREIIKKKYDIRFRQVLIKKNTYHTCLKCEKFIIWYVKISLSKLLPKKLDRIRKIYWFRIWYE